MDAISLLRIPDHRRNSSQRLAFAGLHLGNTAFSKRERALNLDIEHSESQDAKCDFGGGRDDFETATGRLLVLRVRSQFLIGEFC